MHTKYYNLCFFKAAKRGWIDIVEVLYHQYGQVNVENEYGETPLIAGKCGIYFVNFQQKNKG